MTNHPRRAHDEPPPGPGVYACLQCLQERKVAELDGVPEVELPPVQIAATLVPMLTPAGVCTVPACYGHIVVQRPSPLVAANGSLPPGLRPPG